MYRILAWPSLVLQIAVLTLTVQPSWPQVPLDPLDPRIVFDPKNRDATRIPGIINRIDESERQLDTQISDLQRARNEAQSLQSQFRSLSFSRKDIAFPAEVIAGMQKLTDVPAKIDFLSKNVAPLEAILGPLQALNQDYSRLRSLIPGIRRFPGAPSSQSSLSTELGSRLSRQLDEAGSQCDLDDVIKVLKKSKDDQNRFDDVAFGEDADVVKMVLTCAEVVAKRVDLNSVKNAILGELQTYLAEMTARIDRGRATLATMQETKEKWQGQLRRATEISNSLIDWTIPLLAVSVIALLAIPALYNLEVQKIVLSNGIILEVFTVFLLITTVLLLGIADRIQSEALGTLLGGISGYVLGRSVQRSKSDEQAGAVPEPRPSVPPAAAPPAP